VPSNRAAACLKACPGYEASEMKGPRRTPRFENRETWGTRNRDPRSVKGYLVRGGKKIGGQECPPHTRTAELRSAWTGEGARPHMSIF